MATPLDQQEYRSGQFLDRESEVGSVKKLIHKLSAVGDVRVRTIAFEGERGKGKSWLSLHLHRTVLPQLTVKSLLFAFDKRSKPSDRADEWYFSQFGGRTTTEDDSVAESFAHDILRFACRQFDATDLETASLEERAIWLTRAIQQKRVASTFAVVLDSVSELSKSLSDRLEHSFLASIVESPNVIIIMTGRPPLPHWRSPRLRVNVRKKVLEPFSGELIQLLPSVRRLESAAQQIIIAQSEGNPGTAQRLSTVEPGQIADELDRVFEGMLSLFGDESQRKNARNTIEALSVFLTGFREEDMKELLAVYQGAAIDTLADSAVRDARDLLFNARLLSWSHDQGGYALDKAIGSTAARYLRIARPGLWRQLHEQAHRMYTGYAARSERYRDHFQEIADRHQDVLEQLDVATLNTTKSTPNLYPQKPDRDNNRADIDPVATGAATR